MSKKTQWKYIGNNSMKPNDTAPFKRCKNQIKLNRMKFDKPKKHILKENNESEE